jgi:predicted GNAT superfamily acetyltransferase
MDIRALSHDDVPSIWAINEDGLPGTGQVTQNEILALLTLSEFSQGAFENDELVGFVICLSPGTRYGSLNYAWFNQRFQAFIYVDRIAVHPQHRGQGIGSLLYERVIAHAADMQVPVAAEVNLEPPNPGSMRFHHRFHFEEVGVLHHGEKSVTMLMRDKSM